MLGNFKTVVEGVDVTDHKNFCPLPWKHLYKHTDHSIKLCCVDEGGTLGDLRDNTVEELKSSKEFKKIKNQFLSDIRPDRCKNCWDKEDNGGTSLRQGYNKQLRTATGATDIIIEEDSPITWLDYRTSNLCNLGCKICSPHYSSKLASALASQKMIDDSDEIFTEPYESKGYFLNLHKNRIKLNNLESIFSSDLEYIYFAGGEPLLADEHWDILKELKRKNLYDTTFYYCTNGTLLDFKGKNLLEELKDFKQVTISLSLDGIQDSFNYWRTGGEWETIVKNLNKIKQFRDSGYSNFRIGVNSAAGWLNFKEIFRLHKFLIENEYILDDEFIPSTLVMQPVVHNPGVVFEDTPTLFIPELLEQIEEYQIWVKSTLINQPVNTLHLFKSLISKKEYTPEKLRAWLERNKKLDKYFKTNFKNIYRFTTTNFVNLLEQFYTDLDTIPEELKT